MHGKHPWLASLLLAPTVGLVLSGCGAARRPVPGEGATGRPAAERIRPATERAPATSAAVEETLAALKRNAKAERSKWRTKTFEEFERSVYKEPGEGGKYIVSGDTPITDRKQLQEFFETRIKQDPPETRPGALAVMRTGGQDAVWNSTQKRQLTYCVSTGFGSRHQQVVADMEAATGAWEQVADVDFVHLAAQDASCNAGNANVVFDVRPVNVNGQYLARAFFPNEPRGACNVLIDESAFQLDPSGKLMLVGILRHELGHTLGWRHEHTRPQSGACFEDADWRPITEYDRLSVMHYPQCNGGGDWSLTLTKFDDNGAACVYGPAAGFEVDTTICQGPTPAPPSPCSPQTQTFRDQKVAKGKEKAYGPFTVSPGTRLEAKMTGKGTSPGDPDLYVQFGEAPARAQGKFACRPYLSGADEACSLDVPAGKTKAFVTVYGYAAGTYDLAVTHVTGGQP